MSEEIVIAAFYKFIALPDYGELRYPMQDLCRAHGLLGTILLAEEGINATIAGSREDIDNVLESLRDDSRFADIVTKESYADFNPFKRMKVRLKQEIVRLKVDEINPNQRVGTYIDPEQWNEIISEPDVVLIDTRNDYEVMLGTFQNALNPKTENFSDFPNYVEQNLDPKKHKKVAMFCTGGIRCEKATAYMLEQGFEEVYHLNGGILRYLELIKQDESLWQGECFVFDGRVAVDHDLAPGKAVLCKHCHEVKVDADSICGYCGKYDTE